MLEKLQNLISINKNRLKEYEEKQNLVSTEYCKAYFTGLIEEIKDSIWDLEKFFKEAKMIKISRVQYKVTKHGENYNHETEINDFYCRLEDIKYIETSNYKDSKYKIALNFTVDLASNENKEYKEITHIYVLELPESLKQLIKS